MRFVRQNCKFYRGSRPCDPHKATGAVCESCVFFEPMGERIAIVKLGAMGDVLRTTALLPDILPGHPGCSITWFTENESVALLRGIDGISEIVTPEKFADHVLMREYDCVYGLENSGEGVRLSDALRSSNHRGFRAGASGSTEGVWPGGDARLFELGLWDDLKRQNRESYLSLLARTAGFEYGGARPAIALTDDEIAAARSATGGLPRPLIGINTDAGTRWLRKQWNLEYVEAAVAAFAGRGYGIALLGGASVEPFNAMLAARHPGSVAGFKTAADVRSFLALIGELDVLLTGDTLAMHGAWALGVPVVALFGPTSLPEIDLAPNDVKLAATELECLGCYLHTCSVSPHCMDRLTPERVVAAVESRIENREGARS